METVRINRIVLEEMMLSIILDLTDDEDIKAFNEIYTVYKSGKDQFKLINTKYYFEQLLLPIFIKKSHYLINQIKDNNIKAIFIENIKREVGQNQIRNEEQNKKEEEITIPVNLDENRLNKDLGETFSGHANFHSISESLIPHDRNHTQKRKLKILICFITMFIVLCYFITSIIYLFNKATLSCLAFLFPFLDSIKI